VLPVPARSLAEASWLPSLWDWFALGLAGAVLRAEWERNPGFARRLLELAQRPGRCWGLAAAVYTIGALLQHGEVFLSGYGLATHVALGVAAGLVVLPAVAPGRRQDGGRPLALLRSRQMVWLGTISYGIYLWHVPFRDLVDRWLGVPRGALPFIGMFVLTLAGGVLLGAASWYLVERPAQAWVRARRRRQGLPEGDAARDRLAVGEASTGVSASMPLS
jgi:peptidoglycan/LPS O-acetylase OafA/YrhL